MVKELILHKRPIEMARMTSALENSVVAWLKQQDEATLQLDIITLRERYLTQWHKYGILEV